MSANEAKPQFHGYQILDDKQSYKQVCTQMKHVKDQYKLISQYKFCYITIMNLEILRRSLFNHFQEANSYY